MRTYSKFGSVVQDMSLNDILKKTLFLALVAILWGTFM